jgi:peptide deformylase
VSEEHGQVVDEELSAENEARRGSRSPDPPVARPGAEAAGQEVEDFDDDLRRLVERMQALMEDANGVGLAGEPGGRAAPRVRLPERGRGRSRGASTRDRRPERGAGDRRRGCLSLQGVLVPVERHARVTLEAQDVDGRAYRLELEGSTRGSSSTSSTTSTAS